MTPKSIGLVVLMIVFALAGGLALTRGQTIDDAVTVTQGTADLTDSRVTEHIMRLDGTWRFQSSFLDQVDRESYRSVPHMTPHKTATYEADISLPPGQYALRVPRNHPHVNLLIDGKNVSPVYASTVEDPRHAYLVLLDTHTPTFRLTIQTAETEELATGVSDSLLIGPTSNMMTYHNKYFSYEFVIVLISLLIFSFYAIVWLFHRKEALYLYGAAFF
ncbi:histidine kinase, partial [Exiguobacterium mexicanum]|nr:histidine kinase [Exiguobacterium mexicanum]